MAKQIIENYRIISTKQLARTVKEGINNSERFCFILGAGASVSSGIPSGADLERLWMEEMEKEPGLEEVGIVAKKLQKDGFLENEFENIKTVWEDAKKFGKPLSSEFYFDIYKLRFFPNHRNGYYYLENKIANKNPAFGYYPLALMLAEGKGNNLVITTNFDSLVEDALFLYTNKKPLVINHELLADFAGDLNIKRPIIAKVHRGIFFDPLNQPEETNELKGKWHDVLVSVFQNYTPIVIGYGGGDNSLMAFLEDDNIQMKNGIYWCYVEGYGLPNEKIQKLVQKKKGYLIRTIDFDITMFYLGRELFPEKLDVSVIEEHLRNQTNIRTANYAEEYRKLTKYENIDFEGKTRFSISQSAIEFSNDKKKMEEQAIISENKRKDQNKMTAWDYLQRGNRCYELKQYNEAIENYTCGISMKPDIAYFYNIRGYAYFKLGDFNKALKDYDEAIKLNPEYDGAYNNRGILFSALGEYKKAIDDHNEAIRLEPQYANAYSNRGIAFSALEDYGKAISDYSRAIELNPKDKKAYLGRAKIYRKIGEPEIAEMDEAEAEKL